MSLARILTIRAGVAILALTVLILGVFYALASAQQQRSAAQYANAKAEAIARSLDIFDQTMQLNAENAFGVFRRQFAASFVLEDAAQGTLTSYGVQINGASVTEVDAFARDFPGANATVFVAQGEDFRRITTSVKKENGERAIGTLLDRKSAAYPVLRAGKRFVGRVTLFGRPYMTVYEPVRDAAGQVVAVLYIGLDISRQQASFGEAVNKTRIFDSGGLYVVNPSGGPATATLVFHPTAAGKKLAEVLPQAQDAADWLERLNNADNAWIDNAPAVLAPAPEGRRYASVVKSEATGWLVVAEVPASEVMAALYRQMAWLGGAIALAAVVLGITLVAVHSSHRAASEPAERARAGHRRRRPVAPAGFGPPRRDGRHHARRRIHAGQPGEGGGRGARRAPTRSRRPRARSPRATRTCLRAPRSRPARWSRRPPRWKNSPPPSSRTRTTRARPTSWRVSASEVAVQGRQRGQPGGRHHGLDQCVVARRSSTSSA